MNYPYAKEGVPIDVPEEWHVACCDCGLIHVFRFSFQKRGKDKALQVVVTRDNRATAQRRRHIKKKLVDK